ncbi:MAG: type II toxin-antitoxin system RelE/ParE family toxin [Verrucomicrobiota bacterium]
MDYLFHPLAAQEARIIESDYAEISGALADRFWLELNEAIDEVFEFPERQHFDPSGYRRRNLKKFPYHILFEVRLECVRIMVIRHHARNPSFGMRRR